ncbi:MAG: DUF11 domain-containing protein, partial [Chloroflexota bacterium]|nr:DUF11 domain-containing protein [Chloroflexota bacterium]
MAISKEGPAQVAAGGEVTYTLRITNTTPLTARGVTVADTISVDHGVAAAVPSPILRGGRSTYWLLGTLEGNESRTITYTVLLTDSLQAGASVTNMAEVTATGDLNLANNTAVVTATVLGGGGGGGRPDMEATKAGPREVVAGQPFTYTLLAVNVGTDKATDVSLVDALPDQLRFLGADITPTLVLTPTLRWLSGEVGPGEVTRIAVRVELSGAVAAGTVLTNSLSVSAADDANPLNDRAQVTSTVASIAPAPLAAQPVSGTIGARGGTLTSQEGSYVVVVPRRAFSSPLTLSFQPQTPPAATEGNIPLAAFSLSGTLGTTSVAALDRPITVEVKYSDAGLTEENERKLKLYRKTASGAFLELPTQVDIVNNIARATLDHLSEFVLQVLERFSV